MKYRMKSKCAYFCLLLSLALLTGCGGPVQGEAPEVSISSETALLQAGESDSAAEQSQPKAEEAVSEPQEALSIPEPTPEAVSTAEAAPEEPQPPEIRLVMVGDILLHTPLAESGKKPEGGYDFSAVFANLQEEIQAADAALVNQEVIIGGAELGVSGYPAFNAPYELGDALMDAGFDIVLHATNHALDKGKRGLLNCLSFWRENYPETPVLGIHDSRESQQEIYVYEQQGIRIAILNYTYGTNGIALPEDMPYAVDLLEKDRIIDDLQRAQELADFVVVCPHWGKEYVLEQTQNQEQWAEFFTENGADLILGTHPHVIEPIAQITAENGNQALVYYSLGNFVNWTSGTGAGVANRMVGGMAQVTVGLDENGEAVIKEYGVLPVVCHLEKGFGGVTVYPLAEYTEELAACNEILKQDDSFSLEYCWQLVEQVFGGEMADDSGEH